MKGPADRFRPLARGPAYGAGHKAGRVLWQACWLLLARWTPPPLHAWRRLLLRTFGARIGRGARIYGSARIWWPGNLDIGGGAIVGPRVRLYNQGRIAIGAHSVVSQDASLCASTHAVDDPQFALEVRPIRIGTGCWIAAETFVGPGVTMGDGAVLGARAVLLEDAAAMTIWRGNPAVSIRERRWSDED